MSKLTKILTQAAIIAAASAWGTSLAHANITYSLVPDASNTGNATNATNGMVFILDLVAHIDGVNSVSTGANVGVGGNTGLVFTAGSFVGTSMGTDGGAFAAPTLATKFWGPLSYQGTSFTNNLGVSQQGTSVTVGANTNWGNTTGGGSLGNAFLARSASAASDQSVLSATTDGSGNVTIATIQYQVTTITGGQPISLAYTPYSLNLALGASSVWYQDISGNNPTTGSGLNSDSTVNTALVTSTPFVISAPSGPPEWTGTAGSDWNTTGNWNGGVPTTTATFKDHPASGNLSVNLSSASAVDTLDLALTSGGNVTIGGSSPLTVNKAVTIETGTSHAINTELDLGGDVTVSSTTTATLNTGGFVNTNGHKLTIGTGTTIVINDFLDNTSGSIVNNGTLKLQDSSDAENQPNNDVLGTITNGGQLTINGPATANAVTGTGNTSVGSGTGVLGATSITQANLTNNGIVVTGAVTISGNVVNTNKLTVAGGSIAGTLNNTGTLTNKTSLLTVGTGSTLGTIAGTGSLNITSSNGTAITQANLTNAGTSVISGNVNLTAGLTNSGSLTINGTNSSLGNVTGTGSLTFGGGSIGGLVHNNVTINGDTTVTGTTTLTGTLTNTANLTLSGAGPHALGTVTNTGSLVIGENAVATASSLAGGNLTVNGSLTVSPVSVSPRQDPNNQGSDLPAVAIELNSLNMGNNGYLDVTNHDVIIHFDPAKVTHDAAFYAVENMIFNGLGGTTNNGGQLTSSTEGTDKWLTCFDNTVVGLGSWDGINFATDSLGNPDINEIIVKYTYMGDVTLDGVVDSSDLFYVQTNLDASVDPLLGVMSGDATLAGSIDATTLFFVQTSLNAGSGGSYGEPLAGGFTPLSVPEPASIGILLLGGAALLARKRRMNDA